MCLPQRQRSLRESQGALLEKVEELTEHLMQERQRALALEGQVTTATLSLQAVDKVLQHLKRLKMMHRLSVFKSNNKLSSFQLQDRISDLEVERNLIKENYDNLIER